MKKTFLLFAFIGILYSCSNDDDNYNRDVIELNINISNTENYEYNLGSFGDEEGTEINIQAEHFEVSEIEGDFDNGTAIYKYNPELGYYGTDFVQFSANRGSDGASENTKISIVNITFNITE